MDVIESRQLWIKAKVLIPPESHNNSSAYFGNNWPKKLHTRALALLQSPDDPRTRITWDMLISEATRKGALPFETEWFIDPVTLSPSEQYGYHTVYPDDFAKFLKSVGMPPSKIIEAWFFAFGVEGTTPEPVINDGTGIIAGKSGNLAHAIDAAVLKELDIPNELRDETEHKGRRTSQLHCFIWRVYQSLFAENKKVVAQKVWQVIMKEERRKFHDTEKIIQEVTAEEISWLSVYGNTQTLKRSSLDSLLTRMRKEPPC